ncbi:MAG TPA: hypothetical protein VGW38_19920, partial [Chloroflexota bacterium]|nr:hypothetical protein [Chloroflexota bacterium]
AEMLQGRQFSFDDESRALYDAEAPHHSEAEFDDILALLTCELPGDDPLSARVEAFHRRFVIPVDRLQVVFEAAIDLGRQKTQAHVSLPEGEQFTMEYVANHPWSGYNWYQGGYKSLIQVNTDLPIFIDRALDLACHEGYPGHHVYNVLMERHLVRERGWPEYTVYALFSPQSLIAEGTANYGVDLALPDEERVTVERDLLFPLAGLDSSEAARYYRVSQLTDRLSYAGNEAARRYLDGIFTAEEAQAWLVNYNLMSPARAAQRLRFIQRYRSYVINYNLGKDLVRRHVETTTGSDSSEASRWACFVDLLKTPRVPSTLEVARRV